MDNDCTIYYNSFMIVEWNEDKNHWLQKNRGVSFEEVEALLVDGLELDIIDNPNTTKYPNQKIILFIKNEYIYCAPFMETEKGIFLKTIFPDRKRTREYREKS